MFKIKEGIKSEELEDVLNNVEEGWEVFSVFPVTLGSFHSIFFKTVYTIILKEIQR